MGRLTRASILSTCGVAIIALALAPALPDPGALVAVATASPGEDESPSDGMTLNARSVGLDDNLALYGLQGMQSLTIPVPPGFVLSTLDALVELPVGVRAGTIAVSQDDRTLSRMSLPADFNAPVSIPLTGANVVDNAITLLVRSYLEPLDGYCLYDPTLPLRLNDVSLSFTGAEIPPATVAEFLPPVLQQLTLVIPSAPSRAESDAVMRVATSVVAHYGKQNPVITLASLEAQAAPPGPPLPLQRQIVIREGANRGLTLQGGGGMPSLLIGGPPDELVNQTRALFGDIGRLALSSKAVAGPLRSVPQLSANVTTIRQLGQPGVNATALAPQVSIALDQTRLGRPSHDIRVHLRGSYTPLPSSVGGQVVTAVGGATIDSWPADSTGIIDRWVDIPDRVLQRYVNLGVAVNITGATGRCGEFQPITLTIDGDSPVQSSLANPPVPGGFQALPQALMPRVHIGMSDKFDDTRRALAILVGLQRLSALPIDTVVTSLDDAIASPLSAILINASAWTDERITLPVGADSHGDIAIADVDGTDQQGRLNVDPALRFGSLQTTNDGSRTVLVATSNNAPEQLDELLAWLESDAQRWSRLTGDALISAPGRVPVLVGTTPPISPVVVETKDLSLRWWGIGAGIVSVLTVVVALMLLRARRLRAQS
jgi:hypothetical protein